MDRHLIWDFGARGDYAREPIIRRMKDGTIVCTFLTGGPTEPHNDNVIKISRSHDDGATWSEPETLFAHSRRGVWCTELFNEGERPMMTVHTYNAENHYRELQLFRSYGDERGERWTEPVSFPCGLNGCTLRQGIVMSSGEWLFPLYWQETAAGFDWTLQKHDAPFRCGVAISGDRGETYRRFGYIRAEKSLWEPNCAELENGHIVMLIRDDRGGYLAVSHSFDYGRTWSAPETSGIPNPNTKVTLLKVRGQIILINNFSPETGWSRRDHLELWVSGDNMASWHTKLPLAGPDELFFYPHAFADEAKETLYVAIENSKQHSLLRIPYAELGI